MNVQDKEMYRFLTELDHDLSCWLMDNTDYWFEEKPFVDNLRNQINEEMERYEN